MPKSNKALLNSLYAITLSLSLSFRVLVVESLLTRRSSFVIVFLMISGSGKIDRILEAISSLMDPPIIISSGISTPYLPESCLASDSISPSSYKRLKDLSCKKRVTWLRKVVIPALNCSLNILISFLKRGYNPPSSAARSRNCAKVGNNLLNCVLNLSNNTTTSSNKLKSILFNKLPIPLFIKFTRSSNPRK